MVYSVVAGELAAAEVDFSTMLIAPGGRWVILGRGDGSVWCIDLTDDWQTSRDVEPRLLIPSSLPTSVAAGKRNQIRIAIDVYSEESLESSADVRHLTQFNLAVASCARNPQASNASHACHIAIWRVTLSREEGLRQGDRLALFTDAATKNLRSVSLCGPAVAYAIDARPLNCVVIVNWMDAHGKNQTDPFVRRYITPCSATVRPRIRLYTLLHFNHAAESEASPRTTPSDNANRRIRRRLELGTRFH